MRFGRLIMVALVACWYASGVPLYAQLWQSIHKFGPADEELPWILSLGSGPDGVVYAGLLQEPNSFYRSLDQGQTWEAADLVAPHIEAIVPRSDGVLFVAAYGRGVLRSDDNGETWSASTLPTTLVWDISIHGDTVLAATHEGVYLSVDGSVTWEQLMEGGARSVLVTRSAGYLAATSQGPLISRDGGETWQALSIEETVFNFFHPSEGTLLAGTSAGIARSIDAGHSWDVVIQGGRTHSWATNPEGVIFVSTGGVLRSDDGGATFANYSEGLPENVSALTADSAGYVYAGAQSGNVYRTVQPTITGIETGPGLVSISRQFSNAPNPFGSFTIIGFDVPEGGSVYLAVYDVTGRKVEVLSNETYAAGRHEVKWSASGIPSGIYLCRLRIGQITRTIKMVHYR